MSGRKIHDMGGWPHTSDMSMKSKNHLKEFHSADGAGHVDAQYPDTTEMIHRDQMKSDSQARKHEIKPGYRN